ncbi:MAG: hypothetical protein AAB611_01170 [Patescibacteria group bacterium]
MKRNILLINHTKIVCKLGQGTNVCSFLILSAEGFECAKGTTWQAQIAERRAAKSMTAMGDNCSGPPNFESC